MVRSVFLYFFLGSFLLTTTSCRTNHEHSHDHKYKSDSSLKSSYFKTLDDCLVWQVYLTTTMLGLVARSVQPTEGHFWERPSLSEAEILEKVDQLISAATVKKAVDMIIEEEGSCDLEKIYYPTCSLLDSWGVERTYTDFKAQVPYTWLREILGVPFDDAVADELGELLHKDAQKYRKKILTDDSVITIQRGGQTLITSKDGPDSRGSANTCHHPGSEMDLLVHSNFGFCMLKKHNQKLVSRGIFDFSTYYEYAGKDL